MRRIIMPMLAAVLLPMLSGCLMFYTGYEEDPAKEVARRNEPGRPQEAILKANGRAIWYVVFGPDGGGKDTYFSCVRYYAASNGRTNSLSHATHWAYNLDDPHGIIPIPGTDHWLWAYYEKKGALYVTLDVRLFTAKKQIAGYELEGVLRNDDCSGPFSYAVCSISEDGRTFRFPTANGDYVLDGVTGDLKRPKPLPKVKEDIRKVKCPDKSGVSLYDYDTDRILWTVPDKKVISSRTDTNVFVTCTAGDSGCVLRLRDENGVELCSRKAPGNGWETPAVSPNFNRVAYLVARDGGELRTPGFLVSRDTSLCVETFANGTSTKRNVFDVGVGRELEFLWATDEVIVGTWKRNPKDYDHYDYVVINVDTGKWRVLPFDTDYFHGFEVDVASGFVYLRARKRTRHVYDAKNDRLVAEFDFSQPGWPEDARGFNMFGIENGVGMMFAGRRAWMLVGWDGKIIRRGSFNRTDVASVDWTLGHDRLAVRLFDEGEEAVMSLDGRPLFKGVGCLPYADGKFLIGVASWD